MFGFFNRLDAAMGAAPRSRDTIAAQLIQFVHSRPPLGATVNEPTTAHFFSPLQADDRFSSWTEWRTRVNQAFGGNPTLSLLALVLEPCRDEESDALSITKGSTQDLAALLVRTTSVHMELERALAMILADNSAQTLKARVENSTNAPAPATAVCTTGGEYAVSAKAAHLTPPPDRAYADYVTPRTTPLPLVRMLDVCPPDDPRAKLARAHELGRLNSPGADWARSSAAAGVHRRESEIVVPADFGALSRRRGGGKRGRGSGRGSATTHTAPRDNGQQRGGPPPNPGAWSGSGPATSSNTHNNSNNNSRYNNSSNRGNRGRGGSGNNNSSQSNGPRSNSSSSRGRGSD
jgi:hypothetical protein